MPSSSPTSIRALGLASRHGFGEAFIPLPKNQTRPAFANPAFTAADLQEVTVPTPSLSPNDLLVKVKAVAVNPLDFKERARGTPVSGYDVSGIVVGKGSTTAAGSSRFSEGDKVFYMGSVVKPGGFAEYHVVDSRLVSEKPKNASWEDAAAIPLCFLTAWECFEKMGLLGTNGDLPNDSNANKDKTILISPGAGGVGSIAIQIAKHVLGFQKVVVTASREESKSWCKSLGADVVINYTQSDLSSQLQKQGITLDYILTGKMNDDIVTLQYTPSMNPMGVIVSIDAPGILTGTGNLHKGMFVSGIQYMTEFVFARVIYEKEMERHGRFLEIAKNLFQNGQIKSMISDHKKNVMSFSVDSLKSAHEQMEKGSSIGKIVMKMGEETKSEL